MRLIVRQKGDEDEGKEAKQHLLVDLNVLSDVNHAMLNSSKSKEILFLRRIKRLLSLTNENTILRFGNKRLRDGQRLAGL